MRFSEGDRVRNSYVDMGTGIITRHSTGPRSIRWVAPNDGVSWWVSFPDYHSPKWVDPEARGTAGWFRDEALYPEPTEAPAPPLIGSDFTEGASSEPVDCGCGEPITWFQGEWMHIINPALRGTDDHDAEPGDGEVREYCDECGERSDGGEGYDGLCGNCADKAESEGRWQ